MLSLHFLQGKSIDREVFLKPPIEANRTKVLWKLKKCVYGLSDASRCWYFALSEKLESLGCVRSMYDFGVFVWKLDGNLGGILEMHVDDIVWSGFPEFEALVVAPLCNQFNIGRQEARCFVHLGLSIQQDVTGITVDQINYIDSVEPIFLANNRKGAKLDSCSAEEATNFRKLVGKLNWIASQTRPDIAFEVCSLSSVMACPKIGDVLMLNKVLARIKKSPLKVRFSHISELRSCKIVLYTNASLANLSNGRSVSGIAIFLVDENGNCGPLLWKSNTIKRVVRSTLAAETCAGVDGLDAAYFLGKMCKEVFNFDIPIVHFTDNKPFYKNAHSSLMVEEHRLRIDLAIVKEMLQKQELERLSWVPKSDQLADCLTKRGASCFLLFDVLESGKMVSNQVIS